MCPAVNQRKKTSLKVEGRFLEDDDTNKIAVISPKATINIIKNYKLIEKRRVALPNEIDRIFRCSNPDCITNSTERIDSVMDLIDKEGNDTQVQILCKSIRCKRNKIQLSSKIKNLKSL